MADDKFFQDMKRYSLLVQRNYTIDESTLQNKLINAIQKKDEAEVLRLFKYISKLLDFFEPFYQNAKVSFERIKLMQLYDIKLITDYLQKTEQEYSIIVAKTQRLRQIIKEFVDEKDVDKKWNNLSSKIYEVKANHMFIFMRDLIKFEEDLQKQADKISKIVYLLIHKIPEYKNESNPDSKYNFNLLLHYLQTNILIFSETEKRLMKKRIKQMVSTGVISLIAGMSLIYAIDQNFQKEKYQASIFEKMDISFRMKKELANLKEDYLKNKKITLVSLLNDVYFMAEYNYYNKAGFNNSIYQKQFKTINQEMASSINSSNKVSALIQIKSYLLKNVKYNLDNGSVLDFFEHQRINCNSASKLTVMSYFEIMNNSEGVIFFHTYSHIRPGIMIENKVYVIEATESGTTAINVKTLDELKSSGKPFMITDAALQLLSESAYAMKDSTLGKSIAENAIIYAQEGSENIPPAMDIPEGDIKIKDSNNFDLFNSPIIANPKSGIDSPFGVTGPQTKENKHFNFDNFRINKILSENKTTSESKLSNDVVRAQDSSMIDKKITEEKVKLEKEKKEADIATTFAELKRIEQNSKKEESTRIKNSQTNDLSSSKSGKIDFEVYSPENIQISDSKYAELYNLSLQIMRTLNKVDHKKWLILEDSERATINAAVSHAINEINDYRSKARGNQLLSDVLGVIREKLRNNLEKVERGYNNPSPPTAQ